MYDKSNICDNCEYLSITPTPNPYGWFVEGEHTAICAKCEEIVKANIDLPKDCYNIERLPNCPLLSQVANYTKVN